MLRANTMKIPMYSLDLVAELEKVYPARPPNLEDSERQIWFKAGQRSVVETLRSSIEQQEEEEGLPTLFKTEEE